MTRWALTPSQVADKATPNGGLDTNRIDVFNMPSWDIALCQLVNVMQLYNAYQVKRPFALLCLPDKFQD